MPLAFDSLSHGTIAFGFFNIESDMVLLDRHFFFAADFCRLMEDIAGNNAVEPYQGRWSVYLIEFPENIGDLMGAINGTRFTGFIGELYRRFPFPLQPEDFKQNPEGYQTRPEVSQIIAKYARRVEISIVVTADGEEIGIGVYRFNRSQFQELIKYIWQGGYPRWKKGIRPDYVQQMALKLTQNTKPIFSTLVLQ
jgi:hypothetical protein